MPLLRWPPSGAAWVPAHPGHQPARGRLLPRHCALTLQRLYW